MSVPTFCAGKQAETVGGIQWQTHEIETELVCPLTGKKIYRKCIDVGLLANNGDDTAAHGISNLNVAEGAWMKISGIVSDGTTVRDLSSAHDVGVVSVEVNATNIVTDCTGTDLSSYYAIVCLEYTKT